MVRFDICSLVDHLPDPHTHNYNESQQGRFQSVIEMARRGDEAGYGGFWVGEHHASAYIAPSPQMILAAAAMRTKSLRLGTAVSLLPNSDPVRVAEEFAMLDLLSNGRAELGFGSGITEHTFALFGQRVEDAPAISAENLDLLYKLWTEDEVDWKGKFRSPIEHTRLEPRTLSGKPIPITRATSGSERTVIDAARRGQKLALHTVVGSFADSRPAAELYRRSYKEFHPNSSDMKVAATAYAYVQKDGAKAREYWQPYRDNYFAFGKMLITAKGANRSLVKRREDLGFKVEGPRQAEMIGEPAEVVDMIYKGYEDIGGFDELKILFDIGGMGPDDVFRSMDLFTETVLPKVQKLGS